MSTSMKHIVISFVAVCNQRGGGGLLCESNAIYAANVSSDFSSFLLMTGSQEAQYLPGRDGELLSKNGATPLQRGRQQPVRAH